MEACFFDSFKFDSIQRNISISKSGRERNKKETRTEERPFSAITIERRETGKKGSGNKA